MLTFSGVSNDSESIWESSHVIILAVLRDLLLSMKFTLSIHCVMKCADTRIELPTGSPSWQTSLFSDLTRLFHVLRKIRI
ncbi:unnamed protein product [Schistosoma turkestanicum]|nr:unnamed protein product [Schistosoma turkestanicum]